MEGSVAKLHEIVELKKKYKVSMCGISNACTLYIFVCSIIAEHLNVRQLFPSLFVSVCMYVCTCMYIRHVRNANFSIHSMR